MSSRAETSEQLRRPGERGFQAGCSAEIVAKLNRGGWGIAERPVHCHPLQNGWSAIEE